MTEQGHLIAFLSVLKNVTKGEKNKCFMLPTDYYHYPTETSHPSVYSERSNYWVTLISVPNDLRSNQCEQSMNIHEMMRPITLVSHVSIM